MEVLELASVVTGIFNRCMGKVRSAVVAVGAVLLSGRVGSYGRWRAMREGWRVCGRSGR
jgi:hypothetical protein